MLELRPLSLAALIVVWDLITAPILKMLELFVCVSDLHTYTYLIPCVSKDIKTLVGVHKMLAVLLPLDMNLYPRVCISIW